MNILTKLSAITFAGLLASSNVTHASASASGSDSSPALEFDLPLAEGMKKGTLVIDRGQFEAMNKYFTKVNALPPADIQYDMPILSLQTAFEQNTLSIVAMNDACFATPDSGIRLITLDSLNDCVGIFVFSPTIGTAAAHMTMGTKIPSLSPVFDPFVGAEDVQITLLTSYKTSLLNKVVKYITTEKNLPITGLFSNNSIQQMNAGGTVLKRFMDPTDFPELGLKLSKSKKKVKLADVADILGSKISSPIGAVIDTVTGRVSFLEGEAKTQHPHITSGHLSALRDLSFSIPHWAAMRYHTKVKPNEDKMNVDIAFVHYPVTE